MREFSAEDVRYLHVNNEPWYDGAKDETGHARGGALRSGREEWCRGMLKHPWYQRPPGTITSHV